MIETLTLRNFKILREVEVKLRPLTLIVGPNASGKSTILEALRRTIQGLIWGGFADRETITELLSRKGKGRLAVGGAGSVGSTAFSFELQVTDKGALAPESSIQWGNESIGLKAIVSNKLRNIIEESLTLRLDLKQLATPSYPQEVLRSFPSDGNGLSTFLANLSLEQPFVFQEVVKNLRAIVPAVQNVRFRQAYVHTNGSEEYRVGYELLFDMLGAEGVPASFVSEGTLLTLALLTAISTEPPQLVLIDDLERGLHPKALGELIHQFRLLQEQNPELQIVATSHSPYLLDYLKAEEVLLTSLDQDGYAVVKSLTEHPEYERWKDLMAPGEFWSTVGESWVTEPQAAK